MKTIGKFALAASAILWMSAAMAQDDDDTRTTTTHTEHYDSHPGGAYVGVPGVVGVHVGPGGPGPVVKPTAGLCRTRTRANPIPTLSRTAKQNGTPLWRPVSFPKPDE